jgi:RimJ/RimL family protein N-acetyltransferase
MNEITVNEAKIRLTDASPSMYAEIVSDFRYERVSEKSSAYECHGAIILKWWTEDSDYIWYICDLGDSDVISAIKSSRKRFNYDTANEYKYFLGDIPENYDAGAGLIRLKFSCSGKSINTNSDIRLLSEEDRKLMLSLTSAVKNDSDNAKKVANWIMYNDFDCSKQDPDIQLLGIFDGPTLAGAVSVINRWNKEEIIIHNIFVSINYRGRGYATRLICAATAMYPDIIYTYDCDISNIPSIASAKSASYTLAGTYIRG